MWFFTIIFRTKLISWDKPKVRIKMKLGFIDFSYPGTLITLAEQFNFSMHNVDLLVFTLVFIVYFAFFQYYAWKGRTSSPDVLLKICSKFTGEYLSRSVISIKLQSKVFHSFENESAYLKSISGYLK